MEKRIGVVGIVVENREKSAGYVNEILSDYGEMIVGRMGIPYHKRGVSVISIIVEGSVDQIQEVRQKLSEVPEVTVEAALTRETFDD
ncbi:MULTISPECIES: TM1266 family iron-only hydrogenase system putative regulator [unclassified Clostridium]|uniref:TM1266 family iron-only hydrogenase system putative regulator n=1 Tax=unclassified Clostridium TaxID=2614128 RepID=UPI001106AFB2|nr:MULTISPECIES: TM1266 family iron-only hydrogenase system putative regulator [unclassified Clostridium]